MKSGLILVAMGLAFSAPFMGVGLWMMTTGMDLDKNGIHAEATVISFRRGSGSSSVYYPVIEFELENGEKYTQELSTGSSPPSYDIGDPVEVAYYSGDPSSAKIISTFWIYIFPGIFIGIGGMIQFFLLIVFISILREKKGGASKPTTNSMTYSDSKDDDDDPPLYDKPSGKDNPFLVD